jgi:hypothetical protein
MYKCPVKEKLVGKKVYGYELNDARDELKLKLDDGYCTLYAHGDCCSKSWFEGIAGDEALEDGAEILEITMVSHGEKDNDDEYHVTKQYGIKFKTTNGYCDIDMRNESNGYYSGFISLSPDQYGGDSMSAR